MNATVNALDIGDISSGYGEALVIRNVAFQVGAR